jgi:hypothetical protein
MKRAFLVGVSVALMLGVAGTDRSAAAVPATAPVLDETGILPIATIIQRAQTAFPGATVFKVELEGRDPVDDDDDDDDDCDDDDDNDRGGDDDCDDDRGGSNSRSGSGSSSGSSWDDDDDDEINDDFDDLNGDGRITVDEVKYEVYLARGREIIEAYFDAATGQLFETDITISQVDANKARAAARTGRVTLPAAIRIARVNAPGAGRPTCVEIEIDKPGRPVQVQFHQRSTLTRTEVEIHRQNRRILGVNATPRQ